MLGDNGRHDIGHQKCAQEHRQTAEDADHQQPGVDVALHQVHARLRDDRPRHDHPFIFQPGRDGRDDRFHRRAIRSRCADGDGQLVIVTLNSQLGCGLVADIAIGYRLDGGWSHGQVIDEPRYREILRFAADRPDGRVAPGHTQNGDNRALQQDRAVRRRHCSARLPVELAHRRVEVGDRREAQIALLSIRDDGGCQRVLACALNAGEFLQNSISIEALRGFDMNNFRPPLGQSTGLVYDQSIYLLHPLQRFRITNQDALLRAPPHADHD